MSNNNTCEIYNQNREDAIINTCSMTNGIIVSGIFWYNRHQFYNTGWDLLYNLVDYYIYAKSWGEVKYNVYVGPYVRNIQDIFHMGGDDISTAKSKDKFKHVRIEMILNDDTTVTIERDDVVNDDLLSYDVTDVDIVLVYKYNDHLDGGWECAIYHDIDVFHDLCRGIHSFPMSSNLSFMSVSIDIWNKSFELDISSPNNYIMTGNQVFDERFIRFLMEKQHNEIMLPDRNYTLHIMDSNVNEVSINSNQYVIIKSDSYDIIDIKCESTYNSPSEESM